MDPVPWYDAWHDALYAEGWGFYVTRGGPAAHFTTATHGVTGRVLAEAFLALWARERGDTLPDVIVDVGAGRGELATHLLAALGAAPDGTRVVAVDVVDRPDGLDDRIEWLRSPGGFSLPPELEDFSLDNALVIAHEWLDVVPCEIAELGADGRLHLVLVDSATGAESQGPLLGMLDELWCHTHWPTSAAGDRVELAGARDGAWQRLVWKLRSGIAVAVDYGHVAGGRPSGGTLTAYVDGQETRPVPDGTCDITAHVAMDTLDADVLHRQRDLLRDLGFRAGTPPHDRSATDPVGYLRALERAGAEAELIRPGGFGDFWWAVKRVAAADVP